MLCAAAGGTDCHVASLLAMTCKNLLRVRTARTHYRGKFATVCAFIQQRPFAHAEAPSSFAFHRAKRPCNRRRVSVFCMSSRATSLHPRTRPSFCMSLRASAHTGVAIRSPRRETWQAGTTSGKFAAFPYSPGRIAFRFVLPQENGLPRRFAPRNDMQKLAACSHCKDAPPGQIRNRLRIRLKCCFFLAFSAGMRIATSLRSSQ